MLCVYVCVCAGLHLPHCGSVCYGHCTQSESTHLHVQHALCLQVSYVLTIVPVTISHDMQHSVQDQAPLHCSIQ